MPCESRARRVNPLRSYHEGGERVFVESKIGWRPVTANNSIL